VPGATRGRTDRLIRQRTAADHAVVALFGAGDNDNSRHPEVMQGTAVFRHVLAFAFRALLVALGGVQTQAQDPLLWGMLKAGPYAVGYQSSIALDGSRMYDGTSARPILLQVWYPAANSDNPKLNYGAYFHVPHLDQHPRLSDRLQSFARDAASNDLFKRQTEALLRPAERAAFDRLLNARTTAVFHARGAPGRFPVVLYHPGAGGSFEENSVLFEYLASFGYIVVSSAFQSPFADSVSNNVGGIERSGADLTFIAGQAQKWANADPGRLAAMGHSAGAQNILQWIGTAQCPAVAVVSLDTTLEYDEFLDWHKDLRAAFRKLDPPNVPVLLLARANPKPRFSAFREYLRFAPRYEGEVAELKHDDFLTHGFLGRALTGSAESERVRRSYEEVCRTVKSFLDSVFGGTAFPPRHSARSPVSVRYKPALRKPTL